MSVDVSMQNGDSAFGLGPTGRSFYAQGDGGALVIETAELGNLVDVVEIAFDFRLEDWTNPNETSAPVQTMVVVSGRSNGNPCIFSGFHGETYNTPAEISEARNGLFVDRMALNTAPGGEGQWTGGRGLVLEYRIRTENGFLTAGYTRCKIKPWSLEGGEEGSGNYVDVIKPDGTERYSFVSGLDVTTDDVIRVVTSSGAGYGDPKDRAPEAVAADIKNGFITPERAREIYGTTG
ncbi:hydantoinase B/oxoprolinase family protein [Ruegeria sp. HKCCD7255]|uniref:hydantoinase B/oxoprolinase family protein n=1 Tax=Ruegeria sp. HKCCD7255 TaxID=2683004 RepID=UPI0035302916